MVLKKNPSQAGGRILVLGRLEQIVLVGNPGLIEADHDVFRKCPDVLDQRTPAIYLCHAIVPLELEREARGRVGREQRGDIDDGCSACALLHHIEHLDHGGQRNRLDAALQGGGLPRPVVVLVRDQRHFAAEAQPAHNAAVDGRAGSVLRAPGRQRGKLRVEQDAAAEHRNRDFQQNIAAHHVHDDKAVQSGRLLRCVRCARSHVAYLSRLRCRSAGQGHNRNDHAQESVHHFILLLAKGANTSVRHIGNDLRCGGSLRRER